MEKQQYNLGDTVWWLPYRAFYADHIKQIPFSNEQDWAAMTTSEPKCCRVIRIEEIQQLTDEGRTTRSIRYSLRTLEGELLTNIPDSALYKTAAAARSRYLIWAANTLDKEASLLRRQVEMFERCATWCMERRHKLEVNNEQ